MDLSQEYGLETGLNGRGRARRQAKIKARGGRSKISKLLSLKNAIKVVPDLVSFIPIAGPVAGKGFKLGAKLLSKGIVQKGIKLANSGVGKFVINQGKNIAMNKINQARQPQEPQEPQYQQEPQQPTIENVEYGSEQANFLPPQMAQGGRTIPVRQVASTNNYPIQQQYSKPQEQGYDSYEEPTNLLPVKPVQKEENQTSTTPLNTTKKDNTMLYVGIGAVVLLGGMFMLNQKKP